MKFVWPPVIEALAERQKKIADGLAASDRSQHELELAQKRIADEFRSAKSEAAQIIERANNQGAQMVEDAKLKAQAEGKRQLERAKEEIEKEFNNARLQLREQVASIAIMGAERLLKKNIDEAANAEILNQLFEEI